MANLLFLGSQPVNLFGDLIGTPRDWPSHSIYRRSSRDLQGGVTSQSPSENQPQGLLPKSAGQFCTRVSGLFGLTFWVVMTNRFPSGATSYQPDPSGNLKRACSLRAAKLLPLPSTSVAIIWPFPQ